MMAFTFVVSFVFLNLFIGVILEGFDLANEVCVCLCGVVWCGVVCLSVSCRVLFVRNLNG